MSRDGSIEELDDETIRTLLDAGPDVRYYLSKVVSDKPLARLVEDWEAERPDELQEMRSDGTAEPVLVVSSPGDVVRYYTDEPLSRLQRQYADDFHEYVYAEIRDRQRRLPLTPFEFSAYLLSQGAGTSEETVASELDAPVEDVETAIESAREKFRTSMQMIDLCDRFDDPELSEELRAWRIRRDPVRLNDELDAD